MDDEHRVAIVSDADLSEAFAREIKGRVWGQGFPEPRFDGRFAVHDQRVVGAKHLKLTLGAGTRRFQAIRFGNAEPLPAMVRAVYRLDLNEWQGSSTLQLVVEHVEPV